MIRFAVLVLFLAAASDALAQPVVTGTALGPDDRPAASARVELFPLGPNQSPAAEARTDAAGRFALRAPSTGIWRVVIWSSPPLQSPPLPLVEDLELAPARPGAWATLQPEPRTTESEPLLLSGQVIEMENRKPVPGALVWASANPGEFVRTDAEGRFQLTAPGRRRFDLEVIAPGLLLKKVLVARPQLVSRRIGTLALEHAGKIRG